MKLFKLPDLGEGLPDAIIREWYIKPGDEVKLDQPIVSMETAKALVDVPAPFDGKIEKLFGEVDDTIETGKPLVGFEGEEEGAQESEDAGTVVGSIEQSSEVLTETATGVITGKTTQTRVKATPAIRMLAKQLGVDLSAIATENGRITAEAVKQAASASKAAPAAARPQLDGELTPLSNVRRAMVLSMTQSHKEVVPVTIVDDADLHAWEGKQDITVRLLRAIQSACEKEPMLNASFDGGQMAYRLNEKINIGMAVDTPNGLYVPVIKDVANHSDQSLRERINQYKQQAQDRSIAQADLHGGTIILSNFGAIAGRYANPILIPPMVAIVGIGKSRDEVVADNGQAVVHRVMPICLTIDHRAVTGGEAARFLGALIEALSLPN